MLVSTGQSLPQRERRRLIGASREPALHGFGDPNLQAVILAGIETADMQARISYYLGSKAQWRSPAYSAGLSRGQPIWLDLYQTSFPSRQSFR